MSPALAGRFFAAEPPRKSPCLLCGFLWAVGGVGWRGSVFLLWSMNPETESGTDGPGFQPCPLSTRYCDLNKSLNLRAFVPNTGIKNRIYGSYIAFLLFKSHSVYCYLLSEVVGLAQAEQRCQACSPLDSPEIHVLSCGWAPWQVWFQPRATYWT